MRNWPPLIGVFPYVLRSLVFTSMSWTGFGYVEPKGLVLDRYVDLTVYNLSRLLHRLLPRLYPFCKDITRYVLDELISAISLRRLPTTLRICPRLPATTRTM